MKNAYFISILFFLFSCNNRECKNENISNFLLDNAISQGYDYCDLYIAAMSGEMKSIKLFSLLDFSDGMTYEHGAVLLDLIDKVGEDAYTKALGKLKLEDKQEIKSYLGAGFDFTQNTKLIDKRLKTAFPKVHMHLN